MRRTSSDLAAVAARSGVRTRGCWRARHVGAPDMRARHALDLIQAGPKGLKTCSGYTESIGVAIHGHSFMWSQWRLWTQWRSWPQWRLHLVAVAASLCALCGLQ